MNPGATPKIHGVVSLRCLVKHQLIHIYQMRTQWMFTICRVAYIFQSLIHFLELICIPICMYLCAPNAHWDVYKGVIDIYTLGCL